jgi:PhnB protein
MAVKPIPDGYATVTPYLVVHDAAGAIAFYQQAFGATELMRLADPSGKLAHAEIKIGNSLIMLSDEFPEMNQRSAQSIGGTPVSMMLYVEEVDTLFRQAIAAGATEVRPVENQFYGDRAGTLADPFGHVWTISSHVEDVSMEEINARFSAMVGAG